jgi:hypothetical protein
MKPAKTMLVSIAAFWGVLTIPVHVSSRWAGDGKPF